jgi:hypothetical protein
VNERRTERLKAQEAPQGASQPTQRRPSAPKPQCIVNPTR